MTDKGGFMRQYVLMSGILAAAALGGCGAESKLDQAAYPPGTVRPATAEQASKIAVNTARLQPVAQLSGAMPTGVTVSRDGRIFICTPKWGDNVEFTVGELRADGQLVPYPNAEMNQTNPLNPGERFVSVQSVVVDSANRLWALDTGSIMMGETMNGGPKLVCIDLQRNEVIKKIPINPPAAHRQTYLNDVRFDLTRGQGGTAYITDSTDKGPNGIIVVDLFTGESWRKLDGHPSTRAQAGFMAKVEGKPLQVEQAFGKMQAPQIGADGIALSPDGKTLYYRPLSSHHLYAISTDLLADRNRGSAEASDGVRDLGDIGFASDGMFCDAEGRLYLTDYENYAIRRGNPNEPNPRFEILVQDPRMIWPDTLSIARNGDLYIIVNQLNRQARFNNGQDLRKPPYLLMKLPVGAGPAMDRLTRE